MEHQFRIKPEFRNLINAHHHDKVRPLQEWQTKIGCTIEILEEVEESNTVPVKMTMSEQRKVMAMLSGRWEDIPEVVELVRLGAHDHDKCVLMGSSLTIERQTEQVKEWVLENNPSAK